MADSFARLKAAFAEVQALSTPDRSAWFRDLANRDPRLHAAVQSFLAFEAAPSATLRLTGTGEEPSPAPLIGTRYLDRGLLGLGGIGEVRRVHDPDLARTVALKFLRTVHHADPDVARRARASERFVAEAQIQASLQHPSIVPVHERGTLPDGRPYLTMAEIRGATLGQRIRDVHDASVEVWKASASGWTLRRLVAAFERVARAVGHAHTRHVLHRDLKPSNVMVGDAGETWVLDWGLAEAADREGPGLAGTPAYLAPELLDGAPADVRTDVYALGAMLYAVLSGRDAFAGSTAEVLDQVRRGIDGPPGPPGGPGVPPPLAAVCEAAMRIDPGARPASADELADRLRAWLDGEQRRAEADGFVAEADRLQALRTDALAAATTLEARADAILAPLPAWADETEKAPAWTLADRAAELREDAAIHEVNHLQALTSALERLPDHEGALDRMADQHVMRHRAAEAARDTLGAIREAARLREADRKGRYAAYLRGEGALTLVTDPPGATVALHRYVRQGRRLVATFERSFGTTPLIDVPLARGSYLCVLQRTGSEEVRYPVHISRQGHWDGVPPGGDGPLAIRLPPAGSLGPNEVYVPAGWFASGGDAEAMFAHPARRLWCDGFVIQRFPVSVTEYLRFLDDLVAQGREDEALRFAPLGARTGDGLSDTAEPERLVRRDADGRFVITPDSAGRQLGPHQPVMMLVWPCVLAYAAWWTARTRQPWRPPLELEWEKAARGVDGRWFPWGDHQEPSWSYMRFSRRAASGPTFLANLDQYPVDVSVYGVRHVAGNARAWCVTDNGAVDRVDPPDPTRLVVGAERRVGRGGSWGSRPWEVRIGSRAPLSDDTRNAFLGIRLVRRCLDTSRTDDALLYDPGVVDGKVL